MENKKSFICQECKKRVRFNEEHTYQDCLKWKKKLKELVEKSKVSGGKDENN